MACQHACAVWPVSARALVEHNSTQVFVFRNLIIFVTDMFFEFVILVFNMITFGLTKFCKRDKRLHSLSTSFGVSKLDYLCVWYIFKFAFVFLFENCWSHTILLNGKRLN